MRNCKRMPYAQIIRWRIRVSYALLALMLVEKLFLFRFLDKSKVIGHLYVIFFLPLTWVAFAITDVYCFIGA